MGRSWTAVLFCSQRTRFWNLVYSMPARGLPQAEGRVDEHLRCTVLPLERGGAPGHLGHETPERPDVDFAVVLLSSQEQFGRAVVPACTWAVIGH